MAKAEQSMSNPGGWWLEQKQPPHRPIAVTGLQDRTSCISAHLPSQAADCVDKVGTKNQPESAGQQECWQAVEDSQARGIREQHVVLHLSKTLN